MTEIQENAAYLADTALARADRKRRFIIGLSGPPGAGKSTLSEALAAELIGRGHGAAIVPMDGFHLDNAVLDARGTRHRKGAPFTFDVDGYAALLWRLLVETDRDIAVPVFDRSLDLARAGGRVITPEHRFLIAEGNYLLLPDHPWAQLADLFDLTVMLSVGLEELRERLVARWLANGLGEDAALERALSNDIPNAELVLRESVMADLEISNGV